MSELTKVPFQLPILHIVLSENRDETQLISKRWNLVPTRPCAASKAEKLNLQIQDTRPKAHIIGTEICRAIHMDGLRDIQAIMGY